MSRLYKIEIPYVYYHSKNDYEILEQDFYFETNDCSPEKDKVINYLKELHEQEMKHDDDPYFIYQNEYLEMIDTIVNCNDWPNVYEGMSMISTQVKIKGYDEYPLSITRIRPVKL